MKRKELTTWAASLFGIGVLFFEGGWQRMVAMVAIFVVLLVAAIVWIIKKATGEDLGF
jgi:hypothetical protein